MDFFDLLLQAGLITIALVVYLVIVRKRTPVRRNYTEPGWNYPLKWLYARYYAVKRWKASYPKVSQSDLPLTDMYEGWDSISVRTTAPDGTALFLGIRKICERQPLAEVTVYVKLPDGSSYILPRHPDTVIGVWENTEGAWSAGGLKVQVLHARNRMRIFYNGILKRVEDGVKQHVTFNYIWTSASTVSRFPEDWSDEMAAQALAAEQWRDGDWPSILGKWEDGGWVQWGILQGRFQSYDDQRIDKSVYLRTRGVKERRWAPHGYQGVRRSVAISAIAKDGTAVQIRAISYRNVLTECISGCVRHPGGYINSITQTDFSLVDFCETAETIPKAFTINVSSKNCELRVVLRINSNGGRLLSGVPYMQDFEYRTLIVGINGEPGSGFLELGYEATVTSHPQVYLSPPRELKWLSLHEVGDVGYCLPFEDRAAACTDYVGGKGASLALLASVQEGEGYKVPPGFCLTTRALEEHLNNNPDIIKAIEEIEASNEDYDEAIFKEICNKASELFAATQISGRVKDEILSHLSQLRRKATAQQLEQRFAVRSSAVGEDSETLSAAGQNETILGCVSDEDVLRGVQRCWASMFAFTSAYYRRQNGQPCLCGGGVVVQTLVTPRAAGVMFTRHPEAGDPSRLLITANYGLGESVVSGSVEPDTIIVKRDENLTIAKIELGSKRQRVTTATDGVTTEEVPEAERLVPCLSQSEVLALARIGVGQEELWRAGRDIEWAVVKDGIYLLQARPITSLERWLEEELLHELDSPIMSDDDLTTFANCGEVLPKPMSPLGYDLMLHPLHVRMNKMIDPSMDVYADSMLLTHYRACLSLYNSSYRRVGNDIDIGIKMLEMSIHGHKVADRHVINTALHRRPARWTDKIVQIMDLITFLLTAKWKVKNQVKVVNKLNLQTENKKPIEILDTLRSTSETMEVLSDNHMVTSAASTSSQFIAMSVLLEGAEDFTPEQCNEISAILNSGDVLSAEVPLVLGKLSRELHESGMFEQFKAVNPKDAMRWLRKTLPHIHLDVQEFLREHGHRAIMEFDVATKPWVLVPEELMKILQNMRQSDGVQNTPKTEADIIASLKTPKKNSTRKVLRWVLPLCKSMVRHRENTKAHLILGVHKLRLAAIELGKLLVRHWYLPHYNLVFYFLEKELRDYILTRDPTLLRKAIQRQQYFPKWEKLKFAEINKGWPVPLETRGPSVTTGDVKIKGTSVYGGEVIARACVVKDLSEIHQLQQGDVLITHATDIGWSPYFPLLTGIVTELGGLISHGAVIAREYGLPCIVGATSATDIFTTGDTVRLSGTKGIIEKVQVAEEAVESNES